MTNLKRCAIALKAFQKQYPSVTYVDLQTFILGWQAAEQILMIPEEVRQMLLACFIYSSANNNQGLSSITGKSFGEQVETIISAVKANAESQSMLSILARLRKK